MGIRGAVRVMRVEYDHYSKRCPSNGIPPIHVDDKETLLEKVGTRGGENYGNYPELEILY